jgi:hypothetical protein
MKYSIKILIIIYISGISAVLSQNEKQKNTFEEINSNFIGYAIRYRTVQGSDSYASIYSVIPSNNSFDLTQKLLGVAVIVKPNGQISEVRPMSREIEIPPDIELFKIVNSSEKFSDFQEKVNYSLRSNNEKIFLTREWFKIIAILGRESSAIDFFSDRNLNIIAEIFEVDRIKINNFNNLSLSEKRSLFIEIMFK